MKNSGLIGYQETIDGFTTWNFAGYFAASLQDDAPATWLHLPDPSGLQPIDEVLVTDLDLTLRNFDENLRYQAGLELQRQGAHADSVNMTVETAGEPFLAELPAVWLRFRAQPPPAYLLTPLADSNRYALCHAFDGRVVQEGFPRLRVHPAVLGVLAAAGVLLMLGLLTASLAFWVVQAP